MTKKVYARAKEIPTGQRWYLTPGKLYTVLQDVGEGFSATCDDGQNSIFRWNDCAHLNGGNWERVKIDDESDISETEPGEGADALPGMPRVL